MFGLTHEEKIRREIRRKAFAHAKATADEAYAKDVAFRALQASDLHYAIIQDMITAAKLAGSVTIKLRDGAEIRIDSRSDRDQLNEQGGAW
jgi:hypothetical protein